MAYPKVIPISSIVFPPANLSARPLPSEKDKDWEDFKQFKADISYRGIQNLFSVRIEGDKFCVIDGNRRAYALVTLWSEGDEATLERYKDGITVQVQEVTDIEALGTQISANHNAKKQADASLAKAIYKYMVASKLSIDETAQRCGYNVVHLRNILKLNTLPKEAQDAIDQRQMTLNNGFQLTKLPINKLDSDWVKKAMVMNGDDFVAAISNELAEIRKSKRLESNGPKQFNATPSLLKRDEITKLYEQARYAFEMDPTPFNSGYYEFAKKVFQMDDESIAVAKAAFDAEVEAAEKRKREREAKRDAQRIADAEKFAAEHKEQNPDSVVV